MIDQNTTQLPTTFFLLSLKEYIITGWGHTSRSQYTNQYTTSTVQQSSHYSKLDIYILQNSFPTQTRVPQRGEQNDSFGHNKFQRTIAEMNIKSATTLLLGEKDGPGVISLADGERRCKNIPRYTAQPQ